jgi:hypothetical protein
MIGKQFVDEVRCNTVGIPRVMFVDFDRNPVIAVQAIFGSYPYESTVILNNGRDDILGKSVVNRQVSEPERLRYRGKMKQKEECKNCQSLHRGTGIQSRWLLFECRIRRIQIQATWPGRDGIVPLDVPGLLLRSFLIDSLVVTGRSNNRGL